MAPAIYKLQQLSVHSLLIAKLHFLVYAISVLKLYYFISSSCQYLSVLCCRCYRVWRVI